MKNKYSDGPLRQYIEYFIFRHVFLHKQVFMGKFVPSPLTNSPQTYETNKDGGLMSNHEFISFLQTNQETREKPNLNQKFSLGKANKIENTKRHGSATFLGLYTMKKRTP